MDKTELTNCRCRRVDLIKLKQALALAGVGALPNFASFAVAAQLLVEAAINDKEKTRDLLMKAWINDVNDGKEEV